VAYNRGLRIINFHEGLEAFINLDTPAILEVSLPDLPDKRFLAITAMKNGRFSIAPSLSDRDSVGMEELRSLWSGKALIYWKNYLEIPNIEDPGINAREVRTLKKLLQSVNLNVGEINTVFDLKTVSEISRFQGLRGIFQDGKVGPQTLLLLYQESGDYSPVRLKTGEADRGQT
jgi:general secretion pathway protein A